ncbi:MAG TPA: DUF4367 domain-containing protein, partial [Candidatus Choladousia intestinipullorum]|nr:DUF4367 domain-containing protein [Candidatus Choladousia intestinipullorum]
TMDKGQKDKREKNKISPFDITDEMLEDPGLDAFLKESLKQEADEIEAELEEDLSLRGIGASDDMFDAIVEELKEQGIWEEESASEKVEQNPAPEQDEQTEAVAESLESLYAKLPPEDREALELGRKAVQKEQKRKIRRRKRNKILKRGGTVAAALAVVFGLSMTSEANRRLILKAWEGLMLDLSYRVSTDYVGEEDARSKTREELKAMKEIEEKLGAPAIDLEYLPEGMEYDNYSIAENNREAILFYTYEEKIFNIYVINMQNLDNDSSSYILLNEKAVVVNTVQNEQDIEIKIYETDRNLEEPMYAAELEHNGFRYFLNGMDSQVEMEKIAEFIYIL